MVKRALQRMRDALLALSGWDRLLCALCCVLMVFLALQLMLFSFGRDQSIYALVGREMTQGGVPYRDVWDFKPPGIFLVYWTAHALFGEQMWGPRLLELASFGALAVAYLYLGHKLLGSWLPGLLAATVALLLHTQLEFWHTGQPESFGAVVTVLALACAVAEPISVRARQALLGAAGLLLGAAFLLKPPLGGAAVVVSAYLLQRGQLRGQTAARAFVPTVWIAAGALLPIFLCVAWFALRGGMAALQWTFLDFTPGYTRLGWEHRNAFESLYYAVKEGLFKFSLLVPFGVLALVIGPKLHSREREATFLIAGTALVQLCGVALQAKFFPYHYGATLPLLAWLGAVGMYKLWLRARRSLLGVCVFLTSTFALVALRTGVQDIPGTFWERSVLRAQYALGRARVSTRPELDDELYRAADFNLVANRQVAEVIAASTPSNARIFVWGFEPAIYWFAQRPLASKYIYNVPQRATWQRERAREELMAQLQPPPELVVVQHHDVFPSVTGDTLDSARALAHFPELEALFSENYQFLVSVEDFDLYRLSDQRYARATPRSISK